MNPSVDSWNSQTMEIAKEMQKDCIGLIKKLEGANEHATQTDATFIFLFNKIAELELRLRNIENKKS